MVYRDLVGMWVYKYYFPIDELLRTVNEEQVDSIVRRAMRKWGSWLRERVVALTCRRRRKAPGGG